MPETNVANTVTILGKTSTVRAATHWKTIAINDPANAAALKINSLFVTNISTGYHVDIDMRLGRLTPQIPGALNRDSIYTRLLNILTLPIGATLVVISRDNPIWLQPGDFLQIIASRNYFVDVVCSYEFVSDRMSNPVQTIQPPSQIMQLSASQMYGTGGAQLAWTAPLSDGGAPITNYIVQARARAKVTPPLLVGGPTELWSSWITLHKPVADTTSLKINGTILSAFEAWQLDPDSESQALVEFNLDGTSVSAAARASLGIAGGTILGWQFRVAPYNAMGLGLFSAPSELVSMNAIGEIRPTVEALPNRVNLSWQTTPPAVEMPAINPPTGTTLRLIDHRIRWSSDNGVTWQPSPYGQRLYSAEKNAIVAGLQNSVFYTFSVQPICVKNEGTDNEQEVAGPWGPLTRNIMPPGSFPTVESLTALFVRWE